MSDAQNVIVVSPKLYKLLVEDGAMDAINRMVGAQIRGESFEIVQHPPRRPRGREPIVWDYAEPTCPATSPESGAPCSLHDVAKAHFAGHHSNVNEGFGVSWNTTKEEHQRWQSLCRERGHVDCDDGTDW